MIYIIGSPNVQFDNESCSDSLLGMENISMKARHSVTSPFKFGMSIINDMIVPIFQ